MSTQATRDSRRDSTPSSETCERPRTRTRDQAHDARSTTRASAETWCAHARVLDPRRAPIARARASISSSPAAIRARQRQVLRARRRCRARRARSGAGSAGRCAGRRGGRSVDELVAVGREPVDEVDVAARPALGRPRAASRRRGSTGRRPGRCRSRRPASPSAARYALRDRRRRLRPVGEAARRVQRARLVERAGRARVDAEPALAAVGVERRRRVELGVVTSVPRTTHEPCRRVISIVFLP